MSWERNFEGKIPLCAIDDIGAVAEILRNADKEFGEEWNYRSLSKMDGIEVAIYDSKDWDEWVEQILSRIAPHIRGTWQIKVSDYFDEHAKKKYLTIRDGKLFTDCWGQEKEWKQTQP
jgi:hypothetical protein